MLERLKHYTYLIVDNPFVKIAGAYLSTVLNQLGPNGNPALQFLVLLVIFDLIVGVMVAYKNGRLSSEKLRDSCTKVLVYASVLILAHFLSRFHILSPLEPAVTGFISATEGLSIVENIHMLFPGLVPKSVLKRLKVKSAKRSKKEL